jgi:putative transposase
MTPTPAAQYTSVRLTELLAMQDMRPSVGAYDNALMESIIGLFNTEWIRTNVFGPGEREYKTVLDVELATAAWVTWSTTTDSTPASE